MSKENIKTIRQAVLAHRGGLKDATDNQIMIIWDALDEKTREQYLKNLKTERKGKNAVSDKTKREL